MIKLVSDTIDKKDINSLVEWLSQDEIPRLTKGELTWELEKKWAKKIGTKYSVFVNSGSSAILLTLAALKYSNKLKNQKIIVIIPLMIFFSVLLMQLKQGTIIIHTRTILVGYLSYIIVM